MKEMQNAFLKFIFKQKKCDISIKSFESQLIIQSKKKF